MKKITMILAIVLGVTFASGNLNAQENFASGGLELAIPTGDFGDAYPFGIGISGQYEFGITSQFAVTASLGYTFLTVDSDLDGLIKRAYMIPIQVGGKYYLDEARKGLFLGAQLGVHIRGFTTEDLEFFGVTVEGESDSDANFSFAPEVGYFITENISLALRFNIVTGDPDNANYLGLRAAYNF